MSKSDFINIDDLKKGLRSLTTNVCNFYAEAGLYCLEHSGHKSGVEMELNSNFSENQKVKTLWSGTITDQIQKSWSDVSEAVEFGATCIAILTVLKMNVCTDLERSWKGTGFDYWLSDDVSGGSLLFQKRARLEISGIMKGTKGQIEKRVSTKLEQTTKSDKTDFPAYVAVVEFGVPCVKMVKK